MPPRDFSCLLFFAVGLPESRIHDTSLGQATFIREYVSGSRKTVRIYKYYASCNSGKAVFTVYCSDGKVDIVLDNRSTSSGSSKPASGSEPSVKGYTNPEDFYYDHPYDFYDYEEAENYYCSHGGK